MRGKEAQQAAVEAIARRPENQKCADCGSRASGPIWASVNIGVFLCIECCGIHRDLGTHISRTKSTSLDKWQPEEVELMSNLGNKICNEYYEANLPASFQRPSPKSREIRDFIRRKYEHKEWAPRGSVLSPADLVRNGKLAVKPPATKPRTGSKKSIKAAKPSPVSPPSASLLPDDLFTTEPQRSSAVSQQAQSTDDFFPTNMSYEATNAADLLQLDPPISQPSKVKVAEGPRNDKNKDEKNHRKSRKAEVNADLLGDIWSPDDKSAIPDFGNTQLPSTDYKVHQSLGFGMDRPSYRQVQEAKIIAANETRDTCLQDPSSIRLGTPTFPTVYPADAKPKQNVADTWYIDSVSTAGLKWESSDKGKETPVKDKKEDSFVSALTRNLDQLSALTSR
eukprot:Blabericola_migrator_1__4422@NODE_236_length_10991_cov_43_701208_g190_i2_p2_GENE_NODE_236_length_10991_cov_43_701208_g190_i2NODE_236_length_10991_cov_43_701208_g190_i2_p2_ORF_typecomplete_len394_score49_89ArfGap/PF01412_18/3_2e41_NODE_236_length_10991_cov_43_701208_g190_i285199700